MNPSDRWTIVNAKELYDIDRWGKGYLHQRKRAHPRAPHGRPRPLVDIKKLIDTLVLRGIDPPILLRFPKSSATSWKS